MSRFLRLTHLPPVAMTAAAGWFATGLMAWLVEEAERPEPVPVVEPVVLPGPPVAFLQEWCFDCHGDGADKGDLSMDDIDALALRDWNNMRKHVLLYTMPPDGRPSPEPGDRREFVREMEAWLAALPAPVPPVPMRRLNRTEYNESVSALLGTSLRPADDFPDDESAHGFDNNGDLQPLPPGLMERFAAAAGKVAREALLPDVPIRRTVKLAPEEFDGGGFIARGEGDGHYWIEDDRPVRIAFEAPVAGTYRFRMTAYGHQAGDEPVEVAVGDGPDREAILTVSSARRRDPDRVATDLDLPAGKGTLTFRFRNPYSDPDNPAPHRRFRHLLVKEVEIEGPTAVAYRPSPGFLRLVPAPPPESAGLEESIAAAADAMRAFGGKAWRRPLSDDEVNRLTRLCGRALAAGGRLDEAVAAGVQAILTSPNFLFLTDPAVATGPRRPLAVASRLSYFLWSGPPDDRLLAEAARGFPGDSLDREARRMLRDPQSRRFVRDFAGQWLQLRNVALVRPDPALYPEVTPGLREAMWRESSAFVAELLDENLPVLRLVDADWTLVDGTMANYYGLPAPSGGGVGRVDLAKTPRRGILGQAAVLMATSSATRTSPVLRGKWVLENLLGLEPPPPPPNVPTLVAAEGEGHSSSRQSVRESLEAHRNHKACAACHRAIDPPGFALEGFDPIGRRRDVPPDEVTTTLFSGETVVDLDGLATWLVAQHGGDIVEHFARKLMTYALGRGLTPSEIPMVDRIVADCGGREARMRDLLMAVVNSAPFSGRSDP